MPHVLSVQVDNRLNAAVEADRLMLSSQLGGPELTMSQYLRLVLQARLRTAEPLPAGVGEGMRRGFARFMARMQEVAAEIAEEEAASAAG